MGKLTVDQSDLEVSVVSLDDRQKSLREGGEKPPIMPYMSDPSIVPRVQKYLETNIDKTYVDINQMADELQRRYREYSKRKRSAFRASVKKAYSIVLRSYGLEDRDSSENELLSTDSEEEANNAPDKFESATMNNTMMDLYTRNQNNKTNKIDENELIDISSESEDDGKNSANNPNKNVALPVIQNPKAPYPGNSINQNEKRQFEPSNQEQRPMKKRRLGEVTISPVKMVKKKPKPVSQFPPRDGISFRDVGGIDKILENVCKLLLHVKHPELYKKIGISPPRGFLLHGPPGCGKTLLANAIAGELNVPMIKVAAPELVGGVSGESEERIRELFERAVSQSPCIVFIDEIDAITGNRQNAQKEMERRIVAQILSCLDELSNTENGEMVLVIGATNRPDAIDPALRRAGRFDREICLGIPDVKAREHILKVLTSRLTLADDFDFECIAKLTPGYVGADLLSLTRESAMVAVNRVFNEIKENRKLAEALAIQKAAEEKEERRTAKLARAQALAAAAEAKKKQQEEEEERKKKEEEEKLAKEKEEKEKKEAEAIAAASAKPADESMDKDEISIIDDPKKDEDDLVIVSTEKTADSSTEAVVLLDDSELDTPKSDQEKPSTAISAPEPLVNGNSKDTDPEIIVEDEIIEDIQPEQEPMPVDPKELTALEELQAWLHDSSAISDDQLSSLCITMDDFGKALKCVQPSAKREGFATVPDTTWDDVGSLKDIREELQMAILAPVKHAEHFEALGLTVPAGVLLCGPPGCGKTLLAKAIANEAGINFISVKGPELLNMYVGESERAVRVCFERARNSAPCVIFFDELDALCPKRSDSRENGATMRVVNQMLTEMDGVEGRKGVFLLAASNRPDIIDPAVLRPGRLDKILYVGLPSREDRVDILRAITKNATKPTLDPEVDLVSIGTSEETKGYTGADLAALVREASVLALKEYMFAYDETKPLVVCARHFVQAMEKIRPSVSEKDQKHYEKLRILYSAVSQQNQVEEMEYI